MKEKLEILLSLIDEIKAEGIAMPMLYYYCDDSDWNEWYGVDEIGADINECLDTLQYHYSNK